MNRPFTIALVLLFVGTSLFAQNSAQGKEFWLSFMQNGYRHYDSNNPEWVETRVMVSAKRACSGTIRRARVPSESIPFSVEDNGIVFVDVPESWAYNEGNDEQIDQKAVVLTATDTVSVFISNVANYSFDASFVLPVGSIGSEYIIQSDQQSISDNVFSNEKETGAFLIVAVEDNTEIEITPSVTTMKGHGAGVSRVITLSAGQTYSVRSNNNSEWRDLSGSTVYARNGKKIAVFNGNTITRIPGDAENGRDCIFEQALPIDTWGRHFVVTSSAERTRDIVKITSSADDNSIYRDGEEIAIIGYGDSFEFEFLAEDGSCYIETSEPSVVYLYHKSWEDPYGVSPLRIGDPSMVWIPPIEQRINEITFCTFDDGHEYASIANHYVNIVVHRMYANQVYLDDEPINVSEFQPVNGSDEFFFTRKAIVHGTHHLKCESGVTAHVYGFGEARGYAYCVGANVLTLYGKLYVNEVFTLGVHVGGPFFLETDVSGCDSVDFHGFIFDHSMYYEYHGINRYGCDSTLYLTIALAGSSPDFEIQGNHWPIVGSEVYVSQSEYAIQLATPSTLLDTVIWQVDCPNWRLEPHGKGETCTLTIYSFLLEPVMLHATAINFCDTISESFFIQTSYHDVEEKVVTMGFEVFPNPTNGQLTLCFGEVDGLVEILVYNDLGQKIDGFSADAGLCREKAYVMPGLGNGLYYFVMKHGGTTVTRKVMLEPFITDYLPDDLLALFGEENVFFGDQPPVVDMEFKSMHQYVATNLPPPFAPQPGQLSPIMYYHKIRQQYLQLADYVSMTSEETRCKVISPVYLTGRGNNFTVYYYEAPQTEGHPEHVVLFSGTLTNSGVSNLKYGYKIVKYNDSIVPPTVYPVETIFIFKDHDGLAEACSWYDDSLLTPQNH